MKQFFFFFISFVLFSSIFAVDLETFEKEVKNNQDKVIEFNYLREQTKLLGIEHGKFQDRCRL